MVGLNLDDHAAGFALRVPPCKPHADKLWRDIKGLTEEKGLRKGLSHSNLFVKQVKGSMSPIYRGWAGMSKGPGGMGRHPPASSSSAAGIGRPQVRSVRFGKGVMR